MPPTGVLLKCLYKKTTPNPMFKDVKSFAAVIEFFSVSVRCVHRSIDARQFVGVLTYVARGHYVCSNCLQKKVTFSFTGGEICQVLYMDCTGPAAPQLGLCIVDNCTR